MIWLRIACVIFGVIDGYFMIYNSEKGNVCKTISAGVCAIIMYITAVNI